MVTQADRLNADLAGSGSLADREYARLLSITGQPAGRYSLRDLYVMAGENPRLAQGKHSKAYQVATAAGITTVTDSTGVLAKLTQNAKTVVMRGPERSFVENKKPFKDDFIRTTSNGFGISPGGGNWSNTTAQDASYSVNGTRGAINMAVAGSSRWATLIDDIADVNVVCRFTADEMPVGNAFSLGLAVGYADPNNNYRARLSVLTTGNVELVLEKEIAGVVTAIGVSTAVGTGWTANQYWLIRVQRSGTTIRARAWLDGSSEPSTWTFEVVDASLGAGRVGFRGLASTGNTNIPFNILIDYIDVQSGTWPTPTTITHNSWVRVLNQPFAGWNADVSRQITEWASDTSDDVLAHAMKYIAGAPPVLKDGVKVAGQAGYGPLTAGGALLEGADFHEYMAQDWTFYSGEFATKNTSEWWGHLDCSGFVRMVYGYNMGLPMVRYQGFNGLTIPRVTKDISAYGPGVMVADGGASVPSMANMQVGDVVFFDADSSDPGVIDHNGIYLGNDTLGSPRFINSRKTPHGPTFSDLGGASRLDGGGLYATSLRTIRRF